MCSGLTLEVGSVAVKSRIANERRTARTSSRDGFNSGTVSCNSGSTHNVKVADGSSTNAVNIVESALITNSRIFGETRSSKWHRFSADVRAVAEQSRSTVSTIASSSFGQGSASSRIAGSRSRTLSGGGTWITRSSDNITFSVDASVVKGTRAVIVSAANRAKSLEVAGSVDASQTSIAVARVTNT